MNKKEDSQRDSGPSTERQSVFSLVSFLRVLRVLRVLRGEPLTLLRGISQRASEILSN